MKGFAVKDHSRLANLVNSPGICKETAFGDSASKEVELVSSGMFPAVRQKNKFCVYNKAFAELNHPMDREGQNDAFYFDALSMD